MTVYGAASGDAAVAGNPLWYKVSAPGRPPRFIYSRYVAGDVPTAPPTGGKLILVSLHDQWLAAYQDGRQVLDTPVTTGRPALPTPTGSFRVLARYTPYQFISPWPKGSRYYYPPSKTRYALLFRAGGYFIHDTPWRTALRAGHQPAARRSGRPHRVARLRERAGRGGQSALRLGHAGHRGADRAVGRAWHRTHPQYGYGCDTSKKPRDAVRGARHHRAARRARTSPRTRGPRASPCPVRRLTGIARNGVGTTAPRYRRSGMNHHAGRGRRRAPRPRRGLLHCGTLSPLFSGASPATFRNIDAI